MFFGNEELNDNLGALTWYIVSWWRAWLVVLGIPLVSWDRFSWQVASLISVVLTISVICNAIDNHLQKEKDDELRS